MKLLLDTHALLWHALNDARLSRNARAAIADSLNEVFVSPATYWELAIKISIGKLTVQQPFEDFLAACEARFALLPIETRHTAEVARLPFPRTHRDSFDRLIISQAIVEQMSIVSADAAFDTYSSLSRIW